jgi:hypothetical protein
VIVKEVEHGAEEPESEEDHEDQSHKHEQRRCNPQRLLVALSLAPHAIIIPLQCAGAREVLLIARTPRTTMRYDRARKNLDRHPNYILAAFMASAT